MGRWITVAALAGLAAGLALADCSSQPSCTTGTCAASEIQRSLTGLTAEDEAVITEAQCGASARLNAGGTWTVACTVTESDGKVYRGLGNWLPGQGKVTFEPVTVISK